MDEKELEKRKSQIGVPYLVTIQEKYHFYMIEVPGYNFEKKPIKVFQGVEFPNTTKLYFHYEDMSPLDYTETSELKSIIREGGYQSYHKTPVTDPIALAKFALLNNGIDRKNQVITHLTKVVEEIRASNDLDWINKIYSKMLEVISG
jgi:hypothetical protein